MRAILLGITLSLNACVVKSPAAVPPPMVALSAPSPALDAQRLAAEALAEKVDGVWTTHQWVKKAVLLSFRLADNVPMQFDAADGHATPFAFFDKVRTKFAGFSVDLDLVMQKLLERGGIHDFITDGGGAVNGELRN
jgi:hypothetical protein